MTASDRDMHRDSTHSARLLRTLLPALPVPAAPSCSSPRALQHPSSPPWGKLGVPGPAGRPVYTWVTAARCRSERRVALGSRLGSPGPRKDPLATHLCKRSQAKWPEGVCVREQSHLCSGHGVLEERSKHVLGFCEGSRQSDALAAMQPGWGQVPTGRSPGIGALCPPVPRSWESCSERVSNMVVTGTGTPVLTLEMILQPCQGTAGQLSAAAPGLRPAIGIRADEGKVPPAPEGGMGPPAQSQE